MSRRTIEWASYSCGLLVCTVAACGVEDGAPEAPTESAALVSGLVAAYSFDEGAGPTVWDSAAAAGSGTVSGATWTTAGRFGGAL